MSVVWESPVVESIHRPSFPSPPYSPANRRDSGSGSSPSLNFSWRKLRQEQGYYEGDDPDSGSLSPPLWRPGSASSYYSSQALSQRALEIARGRQEMLKLYENLPESAYELSLKDLVDHNVATKEQEQQDSKPNETNKKKSKKAAKLGPKGKKDSSHGKILLNILVPGRFSVFPHSSPSPMRGSEINSELAKKVSLQQDAAEKAKPKTSIFMSILRHIRPSKSSAEISQSSSFSYTRSYSGKGTKSDLSIPVSPSHGSGKNSSNRCSLCSAYTVFFKTKCQVCGKIYCSICDKTAIVNTSAGPACHDTCGVSSKNYRDSELGLKSCFPSINGNIIKNRRKSRSSVAED